MQKDYTYSAPRPSDDDDQMPRRRATQRRNVKRSGRRHSGDDEGMPMAVRRVVEFFMSRKMRTVLGIALILVACYMVVAALSFFKTGAADQSAITSGAELPKVENVAGPVGAMTSHHLFVEGLGLGSFIMIGYIVLVALAILGVRKTRFWDLTFKSLILAITVSMVLGFFSINSTALLPLGGYHGRYINLLIINHFGWIGAFIVNGFLVAVVVTIFIRQLTYLYITSREKLRLIQAKATYANDRDRYMKDRVDDAMADGPITAGREDKDAPRSQSTDYIRVTITDDAPEVVPAAEVTVRNEVSDEPRPATTGEDGDEGPEFGVKEATEIEQGTQAATLVQIEGPYDPRAELSRYRMPTLDLLHDRPRKLNSVDMTELEENKERITRTLEQYKIQIQKIEATVGPTVTLYEIVPAEGVRISKIKGLEDDIAMSLAALGIRIIAPIPGRGTIGIEVPNKDPQTVSIRSILGSKAFQESKYPLPMAMGATINNEVYIADLTKMPHLLVAGATGQGKSVGLNTIIASLLYKRHPSELKFVLVDPKMVEFSLYSRIEKHYIAKLPDAEEPIVTNPAKVVDTLNSLCVEMDNRYALLKDAGCRSVIEYNEKFINRRLNPERGHRYLPYIVMIIDEFADLIMMSGKAVELPIARIAQKARAVGMHMIIATQRPSTNVITGIIKANFPGRIGFRVSQMVDSRTILDAPGANQLIGRGDMLISTNGAMTRVQCAFIDTDEVEAICEYIDDQTGFPEAYILPDPPTDATDTMGGGSSENLSERDSLFEEVARIVVQSSTASTSNIQRRYSIGYNRAGKIMDQLEAAGIVGPSTGGKPRHVLVDPTQLEMILDSLG